MADNWQLKAVISANAEGMLKALKSVNEMSKGTRKYLADVANQAGKLSGKIGLPFAALSGLVTGFGLAKIKDAVQGFGEMGEAIYHGSLRAGMSVEQYQRMKYVADQAGIGVESLEMAMGKLNLNMGKASNGKNKDLAALMKQLGIQTRDANGHIREGIDLLPELADGFKRNKDSGMVNSMGMAVFGKQYQAMLPMLMEGSEGIAESLDRMKRLKGVMSEGDIKGAVEFGKTMKDMDIVLKGFSNTIAKALVPVLQPMIKDLVAWFAANKQLIAADVSKMAKDLAKYLKTVDFKAILQGASDLLKGFGSLVEMVGGAKNALIGLVVFMNLQTIMAFGGLLKSVALLGKEFFLFAVKNIPKLLLGFGLIPAPAVVAAGALDGVAVSATAANTASLGFVGTLGKMLSLAAPLAAALAPLAAMWGVTKWAEDTSHDKERVQGIQENIAKPATSMLSWFGIDKEAEYAARREKNREGLTGPVPTPTGAPLVGQRPTGRVDGQVTIKFDGMPQGARVDQLGSGNMPINLDLGYRSFATGMP